MKHALVASLLAVATLGLATASPAAAFGGETFGCRVAPGTIFTWETTCLNSKPATMYNVGFAVLNTAGSYTYSWTVTGPYEYVITGCTTTSYDCAVAVRGGSNDSEITASVTYSQGGQSATRSATAIIRGYCGSYLC
ncbi:hypothetical protein ACTMS2_28770 [Micromonospora sp. SD12]|uniref:hypothetical protein n=1 Tax=Micromonospora sp. SD12 TaxID=3452216 RepID=UPI003F8B39A3